MNHVGLALIVLFASYLVNITYITVFYHRAFTHRSVNLHPRLRRFAIWTGTWVTGLDVKTWVCMHRLHHLHADTADDPHSPDNHGMVGLFFAQTFAYMDTMKALGWKRKRVTSVTDDLEFPVSWINRRGWWFAPHLLQAAIAIALSFATHSSLVGLAYFYGLMSAPFGGWMVNAFGHRSGYRNFQTPDHSRNNLWVAWLIGGEGYQNNHHENPRRPSFAVKPFEIDFGFHICQVFEWLGLLQMPTHSS